MKATKKWISLLAMAMLLALGLTACSVQGGDATSLSPEPAAASQDSSAAGTTQTEDESQAPDGDTAKTGLGKVLVAYYSGTGETLHEMVNTGNWENGQRFDEDATAEEVERWVESL